MLFCCLWCNVETSCHKYFVVVYRHQQTPPLTTSDVSTCGTVFRRHRVDNTWPVAALTARGKAPVGGFRRNIVMPFGTEKLEWLGYPMVKNFWRYVYSFWQNQRTWQNTDRQTPDGQTLHDSIGRACKASRGKNVDQFVLDVQLSDCILFISPALWRQVSLLVACVCVFVSEIAVFVRDLALVRILRYLFDLPGLYHIGHRPYRPQ